ncbi:hypothetical protein [Corynebacterium sp. A21]|uniref:hypothetical protein n=1 Tax=Corynebacterium sp. A21 TaxID=3457318 RepID=UPI003FD3993C
MSEGPSRDHRSDDRRGDGAPRHHSSGGSNSGGGRPRREGGSADRPRGNSEGRGGYQGGRSTRDDRDKPRDNDDRAGARGDRRDDRRGAPQGNRDGRPSRDNDRRGQAPQRQHAQRGGTERDEKDLRPQRAGFREERLNKRIAEPDLPTGIDIKELDPMVLQDLRVLSRDNAEAVAKHMIMAATLLDDDPQLALRHARAAKDRGGRVAVARETCGIAAYHAGEWKEALAELRAARRMSGGPGLLAVMADAERGLGRPEKALELGASEDVELLDHESTVELAIVMAGARQDLQQFDSAVVVLQRQNPDVSTTGVSALRLSYAYANALVLAGRGEEAKEWFTHALAIDEHDLTDSKERLAELG